MLMDVDEMPVQAMLDKYGRNHAWQVLRSKLDLKDKSLCAEIMIGSDKSEVKHASFEDICKEFSWKSFDVTPDGQTILPMPDAKSFYSEPVAKHIDTVTDTDNSTQPKRKRRTRKAKAIKE